MNPAPYIVNKVSRNTVFVFNAGEEIYELIDPDGRRWVMQTWSQVADPNLSRADLPGLAGRLDLPDGLDLPAARAHRRAAGGHHEPSAAQVLQDNLTNSYSLETATDAGEPSGSYRYWPRFDSVSMARDALDDLPVTRVRM